MQYSVLTTKYQLLSNINKCCISQSVKLVVLIFLILLVMLYFLKHVLHLFTVYLLLYNAITVEQTQVVCLSLKWIIKSVTWIMFFVNAYF